MNSVKNGLPANRKEAIMKVSMKLNIRAKLLIGFISLLSLSLVILLFVYLITRQYITNQVQVVLLEKAYSASTYTRNFFSTLEAYHSQIESAAKQNYSTSNHDIDVVVKSILDERRYIHNITLFSQNGAVISRYYSPFDASSYQPFTLQTAELLDSARSGKTTYSSVYYQNDAPHIRIFFPIYISPGVVEGAIEMQIDLQNAWDVLAQMRLGKAGLSYVVDNNGFIIAHPNQSVVLQQTRVTQRPVIEKVLFTTLADSSLLKSEDLFYTNENNLLVVAEAVKLNGPGWVVVFEQPVSEAFAFLYVTRNIIIITSTISIIVLLIIAYILSNNLTQPIVTLEKYAHTLEKGVFDKPIYIGSHDEIESLGTAFNRMADQILEREKHLREGKRQVEIMIQSLSDGVVALDVEYRVILWNASAERMVGVDIKSSAGRPIEEVLQVYDKNELILADVYSQTPDLLLGNTISIKGKGGNRIPVYMRISPVINPEGAESHQTGWIIAFTDRRKELELEDMKLDFVAAAAHELRTPLTAIRGYSDFLAEEQERLSPEGQTYLNRMKESTGALSVVIDNLLNTSRIERHMYKIDPYPMDIVPTIQESVNLYLPEAKKRNQSLIFSKPEPILKQVYADRFRIRDVVGSLIANALHFTPDGGVITVAARNKGDHVVVSIQDNGVGISQKAIPKLFTKFFRVSNALKDGTKGPGLGLFIAKATIDMHKGSIWVESDPGHGSTFYFTLPIVQDNATI